MKIMHRVEWYFTLLFWHFLLLPNKFHHTKRARKSLRNKFSNITRFRIILYQLPNLISWVLKVTYSSFVYCSFYFSSRIMLFVLCPFGKAPSQIFPCFCVKNESDLHVSIDRCACASALVQLARNPSSMDKGLPYSPSSRTLDTTRVPQVQSKTLSEGLINSQKNYILFPGSIPLIWTLRNVDCIRRLYTIFSIQF